VLDAVMFKPLPLPNVDELVTLYENPTGPDAPSAAPDVSGGTGRFLRFSYPRFLRLQQALGDMGALAATTRSTSFAMRLTDGGDQTLVRGQLVSGNYFATAGIAINRGRSFTDEDVRRAEAQPVAIVSDGFWKRVLSGSDAAVGRSILVSRVPVTIIGIAPPGFVGLWSDNEPDIWMPLTMQPTLGYRSNASGYGGVDLTRPWPEQNRLAWLNLLGRIRPEQRARAEATLEAVNRDALVDMSLEVSDPRERPSITSARLVVEPFVRGFSGLRGRLSTSLFALAGMVAIVLLIACVNLANLLFARSTARAREIGIRISLGASRARLIQQGLAESLLLAAIGGAAGFVAGQ
jgi:MacB-like periplasmic core domain/FtsX-like permease family